VGVGAVLESGELFGADGEWDVGVRIFSGVDTTEQGLRLGARVVFGRAVLSDATGPSSARGLPEPRPPHLDEPCLEPGHRGQGRLIREQALLECAIQPFEHQREPRPPRIE
jgi:hypothetical protein